LLPWDMGAQWAGGELALAGASRYISAESHQSASIGAQQ
jgi:hypothetical protein